MRSVAASPLPGAPMRSSWKIVLEGTPMGPLGQEAEEWKWDPFRNKYFMGTSRGKVLRGGERRRCFSRLGWVFPQRG